MVGSTSPEDDGVAAKLATPNVLVCRPLPPRLKPVVGNPLAESVTVGGGPGGTLEPDALGMPADADAAVGGPCEAAEEGAELSPVLW